MFSMKIRLILIFTFTRFIFYTYTQDSSGIKPDSIYLSVSPDSLAANIPVSDSLTVDVLYMDSLTVDTTALDTILLYEVIHPEDIKIKEIDLDKYFSEEPDNSLIQLDSLLKAAIDSVKQATTPMAGSKPDSGGLQTSAHAPATRPAKKHFEPVLLDSINYLRNPLFSELVYKEKDIVLDWRTCNDIDSLLYGAKRRTLNEPLDTIVIPHPDKILTELRDDALDYISLNAPQLYQTTADRLPKIDWENQSRSIKINPLQQLRFEEDNHVPVVNTNRLVARKKKINPWHIRANGLLQFSQTAISENWYKGGNDFFSLLGVFTGHVNYDNRKKVKWENNFEWRTGFNTVTGDTIGSKGGRKAMPNEDFIKINSKYGVKATGDFYYSSSLEFETQFFKNPKGINDYEMKARLFTPVRVNIGVGMDYQYKKLLSVALSPLSFKYIYLADTITTKDGFFINPPNTFGIEEGENSLREIGSKLIVELKEYKPFPELKINSKFNFYTNYKKVEIDWEIIAELSFNRFFSTRLMLNPRFDNTVIMPEHEKAKIQMKEMITVGFSYRII